MLCSCGRVPECPKSPVPSAPQLCTRTSVMVRGERQLAAQLSHGYLLHVNNYPIVFRRRWWISPATGRGKYASADFNAATVKLWSNVCCPLREWVSPPTVTSVAEMTQRTPLRRSETRWLGQSGIQSSVRWQWGGVWARCCLRLLLCESDKQIFLMSQLNTKPFGLKKCVTFTSSTRGLWSQWWRSVVPVSEEQLMLLCNIVSQESLWVQEVERSCSMTLWAERR